MSTQKIELVDSHCHLDFPDFDDALQDVLKAARQAGVTKIVTICTKLSQFAAVRKLSESNPAVYFAAGVHPMSAGSEPLSTVEELIALCDHPKMVGIGESGLDYHYERETAAIQKESFARHIHAAQKTDLPLIVHARAADEDISDMLKSAYQKAPFRCVMHCFSSGAALAETCLGLGFYLSMSGIATFPKSSALREIFRSAPLDRILIETDSPYLAPVPFRGKRNEPSYVYHTAKTGAEVFDIPLETFAKATTDNFHRLFSKVPR